MYISLQAKLTCFLGNLPDNLLIISSYGIKACRELKAPQTSSRKNNNFIQKQLPDAFIFMLGILVTVFVALL